MSEDRVKDPLGKYEQMQQVSRGHKPSDGWVVAGYVVAGGACIALIVFGIRALLASL